VRCCSSVAPATTGVRDDGSHGQVPDGLRFDVRAPLSPGFARPVVVVTDRVRAEHLGQVAITDNQDSVQVTGQVPIVCPI
jgi:hypothetical protein